MRTPYDKPVQHIHGATSGNALRTTRVSVGAVTGLVAAAIGIAAAHTALRSRARRAFVLRDRTVLITGGARGFGLALARAFGDEGARVVLLSRSADELSRARRD